MRRAVSPLLVLTALACILIPAGLLLTTRQAYDRNAPPYTMGQQPGRVQRIRAMHRRRGARSAGRSALGSPIPTSPARNLGRPTESGATTYMRSYCCRADCKIGRTAGGEIVAVCERCKEPLPSHGLRSWLENLARGTEGNGSVHLTPAPSG
jgi:hypothetical protein